MAKAVIKIKNAVPKSLSQIKKELKEKAMNESDESAGYSYKCGVCNSKIRNPKYSFVIDQSHRDRDNSYLCDNCFNGNKVNACKCCSYLFLETLQEDHCVSCISEAHRHYIKSYNDKAEKHHKPILSKRGEKFKFSGDEAQKLFGDSTHNSFVLHSGGLHATYFGVELEYMVVNNYGLTTIKTNNILQAELKRENGLRAIIKRDGTLRDEHGNESGFEIVSAPADKNYHFQQWDNFLNILNKDDNYFCAPFAPPAPGQERGSGCGCHIHISRDSMIHHSNYGGKNYNNGYGLACDKLQTFIYSKENRKFVEIIAGRKSNMFSNFTQKRGIQFDENGRIVDSGVKHLKNIADRSARHQLDHRTAINFNSSNGKTIEFRIFRSTKDPFELKKNIDFVDAICSFCRTGNASIKEMNDWIYFYEFVSKNRQDYPFLFRFFAGDNSKDSSCPPNEDFAKLLFNKENKIKEVIEEEEYVEQEEIRPAPGERLGRVNLVGEIGEAIEGFAAAPIGNIEINIDTFPAPPPDTARVYYYNDNANAGIKFNYDTFPVNVEQARKEEIVKEISKRYEEKIKSSETKKKEEFDKDLNSLNSPIPVPVKKFVHPIYDRPVKKWKTTGPSYSQNLEDF